MSEIILTGRKTQRKKKAFLVRPKWNMYVVPISCQNSLGKLFYFFKTFYEESSAKIWKSAYF